MRLLFVLLAGILSLPSAAHAQQNPLGDPQAEGPSPAAEAREEGTPKPTVEGAHRFLQELVSRGSIALWFGLYSNDYIADEYATGLITRIEKISSCQVRFEASFHANTFKDKIFRPLILDFSKVEQFKMSPRFDVWIDVTPARMGPDMYQNVISTSSAMAPRLIYALEFIRSSCDPTTATGF